MEIMVKKMMESRIEEIRLQMEQEMGKKMEELKKDMEKKEEESKKAMEQMESDLLQTKERMELVASELSRQLDPWARVRNGSATSSDRRVAQEAFRAALIAKASACQLTGSTDNLIAAHIIPKCSDLLTPSEKYKIYNGMLVCDAVEKAFDRQKIMFKCDPMKRTATLFVLDKTILEDEVCPGKTWHDVQGSDLNTSRHRPSYKLLNLHAEYALKFCFDQKIIEKSIYDDLIVVAKFHSPPRAVEIDRWLFESSKATGQVVFSFYMPQQCIDL